MTKRVAIETAASLNKDLLHISPFEAHVVKPAVGNVRGTGYSVAVQEQKRTVVPAQTEKRALFDLARKTLEAWNPHYKSLLAAAKSNRWP